MAPAVEVLIATYNRAYLIAETLQSVLAQGPEVFIRVEDDGSSDDTEQVIAPFVRTGRVAYAKGPASGGPSGPRNRALRAARAPFVAFFDADDLMNPGYLAHHVALLEAHPGWVATVADYRNFSQEGDYPNTLFQTCPKLSSLLGSGTASSADRPPLVLSERAAKLLAVRENFSSACGVVYRRAVAQRLGGFDVTLPASEDFDIFWRLLGEGPVGISPFCAFRRRVHSGNMSHEQLKILTWKVRSRMKLLEKEQDPLVRRALRRALAEFLDGLAYNQFPLDFKAATQSAFRALWYGARSGRLPHQAMRAAARVCLRGA